MAWSRLKNPRSSAQPATSSQVTVGPMAAAEPEHWQNTGISGASHTVANPVADSGDTAPPVNGRGPRPIRFAHSGFQGSTPIPGDNAPGDFAETPEPAFNGTAIGDESPDPGRTAPANEGLSILGGIPTTEVPDDDAPTRDLPQQQPPSVAPAAAIIPVTSGPSGATWNQRLSQPPQPVEGADEGQRGSFWMTMNGLLRGPAADDNGQPRKTFRELPPDTQLRFWRYRLLIMLVVGVVFGLLTAWYIGLTLAILAGIIDTIYRARNAAYYDNGATHPGARKRTSRQLRRMRRAGYLALDARPIPNSREVIDHLVIGPTGVYAIDSERWDRRLPVRTLNGKRLYLGPASQKDRLEHAVWEASQASELLSKELGTQVEVRPALAIYGPQIPWDIATIRNVDVFTGTALRKYLKRRSKQREARRLSREEVQAYFAAAVRVLPDVSPTRTATPVG